MTLSRIVRLTDLQFLAFIIGFVTHNIAYTLWVGLGGTALTFLVVVPPWPFYNKHPVQWLPAKSSAGSYDITVDGRKIQ